MNSTRLPGKPLEKIGPKSIVEHCIANVKKAKFTPYVATDSGEIEGQICTGWERHFTHVIRTGEHPSGTDRVAAAAEIIDPDGKQDVVVNYQGDMPFLDPDWLSMFAMQATAMDAEVVTAYCDQIMVTIRDETFYRQAVRQHIGLYAYERKALRRFASMPQSEMEILHSLEQLRAPDQFTWGWVKFPSMPIEINTQADLDRARSCLM